MSSKKESTTPTIQVIERMFSLLDVLAAHPDPVSLKQISEQTGLHPSTAHRILNDLAIGRYVDRFVRTPEGKRDMALVAGAALAADGAGFFAGTVPRLTASRD